MPFEDHEHIQKKNNPFGVWARLDSFGHQGLISGPRSKAENENQLFLVSAIKASSVAL